MPITIQQSIPKPSSVTLTDEKLMREIGYQAITAIRARTRQGRDSDGKPFAPYSPGYARLKRSTHVDLTVSGDMLNTLQIVNVTATSVTLGWTRGDVR